MQRNGHCALGRLPHGSQGNPKLFIDLESSDASRESGADPSCLISLLANYLKSHHIFFIFTLFIYAFIY